MTMVRVAVGAVLLVLFSWLSVLNWGVFWKRHVKHVEAPSWIPFLGGLLGVAGALTLPIHDVNRLAWLPLLLDWGSVPGVAYSVYALVRRRPPQDGTPASSTRP